uniref:Gsp-co-occurring protein 16 n=1 Tax=Malawimonas jakobiformis TaxID=136089 RepID=A0A895KQW5_MALJA|nr:Gsp-co-occurring protein 16 [Malawimonas jakobiformis]
MSVLRRRLSALLRQLLPLEVGSHDVPPTPRSLAFESLPLSELLVLFNKLGHLPEPGMDITQLTSLAARRSAVFQRCNVEHDFPEVIMTLGFTAQELIPTAHLAAVMNTLQVYDVSPDWVFGFYSKKNIPLFAAACSWEFPQIAFIQLHPWLRKGATLLQFDRTELIAHEIVHIVRGPLNSSRFEELLAYSLSPSRFRRWISPVLQQPNDAALFAVLAMLSVLADLYLTRIPRWLVVLLKLPVAGTAVAAFVRMWRTRSVLNRARDRLLQGGVKPQHALPILFRLTDAEIEAVAAGTLSPAKLGSSCGLRGRMLQAAYLNGLVQ